MDLVDDEDALRLAERIVETVMARQHPGLPAFYALLGAHRAVRRAMQGLDRPGVAGGPPKSAGVM